jgi:hypothetical protein
MRSLISRPSGSGANVILQDNFAGTVIIILVSSTNGAGIEAEYLLGGEKFIDMQAIRRKWGALSWLCCSSSG